MLLESLSFIVCMAILLCLGLISILLIAGLDEGHDFHTMGISPVAIVFVWLVFAFLSMSYVIYKIILGVV